MIIASLASKRFIADKRLFTLLIYALFFLDSNTAWILSSSCPCAPLLFLYDCARSILMWVSTFYSFFSPFKCLKINRASY